MSKVKHGKETSKHYKPKRPLFNFTEMGIPIGSKLTLLNEGISAEVYVSSGRKVKTVGSDEETYLSQITQEILDLKHNKIHPTRYWSYEEKSLNVYYDETYGRK